MARFRRILYLERRARGSARAYYCAVHTALVHGASLTLAGVEGGRRLGRMAERADTLGLPVRLRDVDLRAMGGGGAGVVPMDMARAHDLVITVTRGKGSRWWSGADGVARALVRECGVPTWLLHPLQSAGVRVVVAAIDVSGPAAEATGRRVVRTAADLAAESGAELVVLHCWSVVGESMIASRSRGGGPARAERILAAAERSRHRRVERLLEAAGIPSSTTVVLQKGDVVGCIEDVVWRTEADVVVVGSAARRGLSALLVGNTAERLVGRVPASVLVVPAERRPRRPVARAG